MSPAQTPTRTPDDPPAPNQAESATPAAIVATKNVASHSGSTSNLKRTYDQRSPRPTEEISHDQDIGSWTNGDDPFGNGAKRNRKLSVPLNLNPMHHQANSNTPSGTSTVLEAGSIKLTAIESNIDVDLELQPRLKQSLSTLDTASTLLPPTNPSVSLDGTGGLRDTDETIDPEFSNERCTCTIGRSDASDTEGGFSGVDDTKGSPGTQRNYDSYSRDQTPITYLSSGYKSQLYLPRNPALTAAQADEPCDNYTIPENLLVKLNSITGYNLALEEPNLEAGLCLLISGRHDFGTAYSWFRTAFILVSDNLHCPVPEYFALYAGLPDLSHCDASLTTAERPESTSLDQRLTVIRQAENGERRIVQPAESHPRRLWDFVSNRVIPYDWHARTSRFHEPMCYPLTQWEWKVVPFVAISHSWVNDRSYHLLPVNRRQWPIPLPEGVTIEDIRGELQDPQLPTGVTRLTEHRKWFIAPPPESFEYCWLDILCLRQTWGEIEGNLLIKESEAVKRHALPAHILLLEKKLLTEWEIDVSMIGAIYRRAKTILVYMNGIGRPFSDKKSDWKSPHHWINRTWTLQEYCKCSDLAIVMGLSPHRINNLMSGSMRTPKEVCSAMRSSDLEWERRLLPGDLELPTALLNGGDFNNCLRLVAHRHSSKNVDKVGALFFLLGPDALPEFPAYKQDEHIEGAWKRFINALTNQWKWEVTLHVSQPFDQLFPTWNALMSSVIDDRRDRASLFPSAEPLVGSLGLCCRTTPVEGRNVRLPNGEESEYRQKCPWGRLHMFHLRRWTLYLPDTGSKISLRFMVGGLIDRRTEDSDKMGTCYLVPQLCSTWRDKPTCASEFLFMGSVWTDKEWLRKYAQVYFLVCVPRTQSGHQWDGISLKKVGVAMLAATTKHENAIGVFGSHFDHFYQGKDLQILRDTQKLSPQAMQEKYGSGKVYSLIY